ncbi:primosome assembly protein PriA [Janibacter sp. GXQ6167]|uniref:primosomal protein N' family DNA-binding protein n=1 Tax=Janibacter sp. GXQ6167 TaxID=3240791 RepID=UPI0035240DEF
MSEDREEPSVDPGTLALTGLPEPKRPHTRGVAEVLVDTGLAHLDRPFDYAVPAELEGEAVPGARVRVRFAGQDLAGYIVSRPVAPSHQGRLTPVRSVVSAEPVLTPPILEAAQRIAAQGAGTVGDVLRLAIPPRHARAERALADQAPDEDEGPALEETPPVWAQYRAGAAWWSRVAAGESPWAAWLAAPGVPPDLDWPYAFAAAAAGTLASGRGSIIVVPDGRDVARVSAALDKVLGPKRHVTLTADQGPQARYTAWLKVLRGHVRVVVGTRAAAYAPVRDLGLVAWWDDGDDLHDEPRAPYPHTRDVLITRAGIERAAVLAGGFAMSVPIARLVAAGTMPVIDGATDGRPRVSIAGEGLDAERDGPAARARIPSAAWRVARSALERGPVLIQVPRRGYLPSLMCADCRRPARCQVCEGPMALDGPDGPARCRWCGTVPRDPFRCPACDSIRVRSGVIGARRTAEEIGRAFPGTKVITSGSGEVLAAVGSDPALVIATPGAEPVADGGYAAALLLDAWALLDRPSLEAGPEALRRWLAAAALVRPSSEGGEVVLCGAPTHAQIPAIEALVRWGPAWLAERELEERAELHLPPTTWSATVRTPRARAEGIAEQVRAAAPGVEVLGPFQGGEADRRALLVRAPWESGGAVAATLRGIRATESGRKLDPLTAIRVGGSGGYDEIALGATSRGPGRRAGA